MAINTSQDTTITTTVPSTPLVAHAETDPVCSPPSTASPSFSTASSFSTTSTESNNDLASKMAQASPTKKHRPKNGYVARVGFDTLDCEETPQYTFTLQSRTDKWKRTSRTRTFLVGTDLNEHSSHALVWTMENMIEDGDEVRLTLYVKKKIYVYPRKKYYCIILLFVCFFCVMWRRKGKRYTDELVNPCIE